MPYDTNKNIPGDRPLVCFEKNKNILNKKKDFEDVLSNIKSNIKNVTGDNPWSQK